MDTATQTLTFLILVLTFAVVAVSGAVTLRRRGAARRRGVAEENILPKRVIDAYEQIPTIIGQAVEADRPVLFSTGRGALGDSSTLITLAGTAITYYITQRATVGDTPPLFLTSQTSTIPLGYDILRRAYLSRGLRPNLSVANVRWFPSGLAGDRSLVFAAMLTATISSDSPAGSVLVGRFDEELALALLSSQQAGAASIAGSDTLVGQAVAYAMADSALIGEDVYSAVGYLGQSAGERGALTAQDTLRGLLIVTIILIAIYAVAGEQVANLLAPVLGRF